MRKRLTNLSKTEKSSSSFQNLHFTKSSFHGILISRISGLNREAAKSSFFEVEPLRVPLTMMKRYNIQLLKIHKFLFVQAELQRIKNKAKIFIEIPYLH